MILVSVLCIAGLLGTQFWLLAYAGDAQEERLAHAQIRQELLALQRSIAEVDMAFRGYVLVRQPQFLEPMGAAERQIPDTLERLAVLAAPWSELRGRVRMMSPRVKDFMSTKRQLTKRLDEGLEEGVLLYIRTGEGIALANTLAFGFKDLENRIQEGDRIRETDWRDRRIRVGTGIVLTTLASLALGVGIGRVCLQLAVRTDKAVDSAMVNL